MDRAGMGKANLALTLAYTLLPIVADTKAHLTLRQFALMLLLYLDLVPATVTSMAAAMTLPKSSITRMATKLQKQNMLRRKVNRDDQRLIFLVLTERGRRFIENLESSSRTLPTRLQIPAQRPSQEPKQARMK